MKPKFDRTPFGCCLQEILEDRNKSYSDLAEYCGVTLTTIYTWLKDTVPTRYCFRLVDEYLNLTNAEYNRMCKAIGQTVERRYKGVRGMAE